MTWQSLGVQHQEKNHLKLARILEKTIRLGPEALWQEAVRRNEGVVSKGGALVVSTGKYTGRSPNDKFIVIEPSSENHVWWGSVNRPFEENRFNELLGRVLAHLGDQDLYSGTYWIGADLAHRRKLSVITETAWHNLFASNMFITESLGITDEKPADFTFVHAPGFKAVPERDGTNSEAFVIINFGQRIVLIGGTSYAGEIKKSAFTLMNYLLPFEEVFPMHCSANMGTNEDVALFFGLSGTGKTTLSATKDRVLVGDDEHGWSKDSVFNFEGGCYAKVIRLSQQSEPEIFATTHQFGTILENVTVDVNTRELDLNDDSITENTRGSYPLTSIPNASYLGIGHTPRNILMLTADAFGVMPAIAKLTHEEAEYYFLSGYTAKVAGTERGIIEPSATFSPCFGAPFMPMKPKVYTDMLSKRLKETGADVWLINTGWTGGPYGIGHRMKIEHTRAMVNAILDGSLAKIPTEADPVFGIQVPIHCPGVPTEILKQKDSWKNPEDYDIQANKLVSMFKDNFAQFL